MANNMRISVSKMQSDAGKIETELKKVTDSIEELDAALSGLSACWEGAAWQSFQSQVYQDIANMNKARSFLRKLSNHLESAGKSYSDADKEVYRHVNQI